MTWNPAYASPAHKIHQYKIKEHQWAVVTPALPQVLMEMPRALNKRKFLRLQGQFFPHLRTLPQVRSRLEYRRDPYTVLDYYKQLNFDLRGIDNIAWRIRRHIFGQRQMLCRLFPGAKTIALRLLDEERDPHARFARFMDAAHMLTPTIAEYFDMPGGMSYINVFIALDRAPSDVTRTAVSKFLEPEEFCYNLNARISLPFSKRSQPLFSSFGDSLPE